MSLVTIDATSWISAWRRDTKLFEWATLVTSLAFSGAASFLFACGAALVALRSCPVAIGSGMISAAVMMTVVWRRSPLTAGTVVAVPEKEAETELLSGVEVIEKR